MRDREALSFVILENGCVAWKLVRVRSVWVLVLLTKTTLLADRGERRYNEPAPLILLEIVIPAPHHAFRYLPKIRPNFAVSRVRDYFQPDCA